MHSVYLVQQAGDTLSPPPPWDCQTSAEHIIALLGFPYITLNQTRRQTRAAMTPGSHTHTQTHRVMLTHTHTHTHTHTESCSHTHTHTETHTYQVMLTHTESCLNTDRHTPSNAQIHTESCSDTRIHTDTHTNTSHAECEPLTHCKRVKHKYRHTHAHREISAHTHTHRHQLEHHGGRCTLSLARRLDWLSFQMYSYHPDDK